MIDQEVRLKNHLNRSLLEHSYCCSAECKRVEGETRKIKEFAII